MSSADQANTSSKLGHTTAQDGLGKQAPAQGFQGSADGNSSAMAGASNPAIGGNQNKGDGPAQEVAGTLPQDFTLKGMKAEYKGEDKQGEFQSHEFDIPDTYDASRPRENIGENQKYGGRLNP